MRTAIRKIGNSQGVLIPKPMLAETGLNVDVDISVENGAIVLRSIRDHQPRAGWADAARDIAAQGADAPVWPEFANAGDAEFDMVKVKRGDIWLAALDPTVGAEIQKTRPCVIVSPPEINDWLRTVLVAPMTTGSHPAPFRIPVSFSSKKGLILPEQMRALDKARLVKRMGKVDAATLSALLGVLRDTFEE